MPSIERKIVIETVSILKVIGVLLTLGFLYLIRDILALVFIALFLAALMHPAARYLAKKKIPKGVTVICMYVFLLGLAILTVSLLIPPLIEQSANLVSSVGKSWQTLSGGVHWLQDISVKYGLSDNLQSGLQSLQDQLSRMATGLFQSIGDVIGGFVALVIILVMAYYMVVQDQEAQNIFHNFVPEEYKEVSTNIIKRVEEKISKWLVGQLSLCLIIGAMYFIGLTLIGVNSALVLALFGGFTEFIPYLGPILGAIPVLIMALTASPVKALLALAVVIVIQQFEGHIIVPKVMQKAVGLNPLVSIIALLVGAKLFGITGALLAIPVATAVSAVLMELYRYRTARE